MTNAANSARPWRWALLLIALLFVALIAYRSLRLWPHVSSLLHTARTVQALAAGSADPSALGGLAGLQAMAARTQQDLEALRTESDPLLPLAGHLGWLPGVGGDLAAAPTLLEMSIDLCSAGSSALLGLEPALAAIEAGGAPGPSALEAALPALAASAPRFGEAEQAILRARAARERLEPGRLSARLANLLARLDRYLPILEAGTRLAQRAPALLGQDRQVTYLLLAQNSDELRPTGGFISGVGIARLDRGRMADVKVEDSYLAEAGCALEAHPTAPAPLRQYMWSPVLMLRDANWSPDFPSSAAVAQSIYRNCKGKEIDGVVAVDIEGVAQVLGALGPLQPEGYPEPVTADNLSQYIAQYWGAPVRSGSGTDAAGDWWLHHKDFMGDLLAAAVHKVTTRPDTIDPRRLAGALFDALRSKHILVYLRDPAAQRAIVTAGWDGALRPAAGDYLLLVDSNLGFLKVNPNIREALDYQVELGGAAPRATLRVRYTNKSSGPAECIAGSHYERSYTEMMQGCYWDYVRVYVPRGSRLLAVAGADSPPQESEEQGKAVFSAFMVLAPGQSRELVFSYTLPAVVGDGAIFPGYRLLVQRQPGSAELPVKVHLSGAGRPLQPLPGDMAGSMGEGEAAFKLAADTELAWVAGAGRRTWPEFVLGVIGAALIVSGLALAGGRWPGAGGER